MSDPVDPGYPDSYHSDSQPVPVPPRRKSSVPKVILGCGIGGCLGAIVLAVVGLAIVYFWITSFVEKHKQEFLDRGFVEESAQILEFDYEIDKPTVYVAQVVSMEGGASAEVAVIGQVLEIKEGVYKEKVYFRGQVVEIKKGVVLEKGLDVYCQIVKNNGEIVGGVSGTYQVIDG